MNSLTDKLMDCKAGCYIDMQCINHVLYADDTCRMTPTATAMLLPFVITMVCTKLFIKKMYVKIVLIQMSLYMPSNLDFVADIPLNELLSLL